METVVLLQLHYVDRMMNINIISWFN